MSYVTSPSMAFLMPAVCSPSRLAGSNLLYRQHTDLAAMRLLLLAVMVLSVRLLSWRKSHIRNNSKVRPAPQPNQFYLLSRSGQVRGPTLLRMEVTRLYPMH